MADPRRLVNLRCAVLALAYTAAGAAEPPCANPDYRHGISYMLPLKYPASFTHFEYANPDAPKAGEMRLPQLGTFDNYNVILEKGRNAAGYDLGGGLVYDRLLEPAIDEPVSSYGRLAEGVALGPDLAWIAFKLRSGATWHDGQPITVEDVLFSFQMFQEHGSVALQTVLAEVGDIFPFGEREICFVRKGGRRTQSHPAVRHQRPTASCPSTIGKLATSARPPSSRPWAAAPTGWCAPTRAGCWSTSAISTTGAATFPSTKAATTSSASSSTTSPTRA